MNKVELRCQRESSAKFHYASVKMFTELKILKVLLYILAIVPVVLQLIPKVSSNAAISFLYTLISFFITVLSEVLSSFMTKHKKNAILEYQLYESEITGSTFSKIEYDRESTNSLNELGIRKGLSKARKAKSLHIVEVPEDISDDYSYLYLCRKNAATTNFLLGRMFVIYMLFIVLILVGFAGCMFLKNNTFEYLQLIIGFYPLVLPLIKDSLACKEAQRGCVKICADIDNFFADGDDSIERLARFYYYTQNIEFEMMNDRPPMYSLFNKMFKRGINILQDGVTYRFKDAVSELKIRSSGLIQMPKGKSLITRVDYSLEDLEKKQQKLKEQQRLKRMALKTKATNEVNEEKDAMAIEKPKTPVKKASSTKTVTKVSSTAQAGKNPTVAKTKTTKAKAISDDLAPVEKPGEKSTVAKKTTTAAKSNTAKSTTSKPKATTKTQK